MDPTDFAQVAPTVLNWATVGIMAVTFIVFMKFILAKFPLPGISTFIAAA